MAEQKMGKPTAQGGMWNTAKPQFSKQTQDLLKEMMRESKLTNFQQRQLDKVVKGGKSLPPTCNPTTSAKPRLPGPPTKKQNSLVIDPKKYNPAVRTQDKIESTGAYEREQYAPAPLTKYGGFYEEDKRRLANMMAWGEDIEPKKNQRPVQVRREDTLEMDRFDELQKEVEDRQRFLGEMEKLGQDDKVRTIINTEISRIVREMEVIDKKRSAELQKMIEADNKRREDRINGIPS